MLHLLLATALLAGAPTRDAAEKSADARDRIICKRFVETGSLIRGYRTCQAKRDWDRERENIRTLGVSQSCGALAEGGSCR